MRNDIGQLTPAAAGYYNFPGFKGDRFEFKRIVGPKKNDTVTVSLLDDNKKIKTVLLH